MATASRDILYGRLTGFQIDVARLRNHYESVVAAQPATPYKDNEANYVGWAVTSRMAGLMRLLDDSFSLPGVQPVCLYACVALLNLLV